MKPLTDEEKEVAMVDLDNMDTIEQLSAYIVEQAENIDVDNLRQFIKDELGIKY